MKPRVFVFSYGDVEDKNTWSGTNHHLYYALKRYCHVVGVIDRMDCLRKKVRPRIKVPYDFIFHISNVPPMKHDSPFSIYTDVARRDCDKEFITWRLYGLPKGAIITMGRRELKMEAAAFMAASRIFTFCDYIKKVLIRDYKIDPKKIITVGAGPNFKRLPKKVDKQYDGKTILFVGRDFFRKGGIALLGAFKIIKKEIPDARLIIVSYPLKVWSRGRNLESLGIIIKEKANKRLLGVLYRKASVFVMPSLYEAFGIAFLEAMAYKLPCIGTNKCAMPEIIDDGKTGFLVPPNNPQALAEKIIFLLRHKKIAREMGERGRKKVINYYNWDLVAKRMVNEFDSILNKRT